MQQPRYLEIRRTDGKIYYQFAFICICGYEAEVGVPQNQRGLIACPECQNLFAFHRPVGMFARPELLSIITTKVVEA